MVIKISVKVTYPSRFWLRCAVYEIASAQPMAPPPLAVACGHRLMPRVCDHRIDSHAALGATAAGMRLAGARLGVSLGCPGVCCHPFRSTPLDLVATAYCAVGAVSLSGRKLRYCRFKRRILSSSGRDSRPRRCESNCRRASVFGFDGYLAGVLHLARPPRPSLAPR